MTAPWLAVEELRLRAGSALVLDGISLAIARGECVAVVGESRAGKSALARAAAGLAGTDEVWGRVALDGRTIVMNAYAKAKHVAFLPSDLADALHPTLSLDVQVHEALRARDPGATPEEIRRRTRFAFARAGFRTTRQVRAAPDGRALERARGALAIALAGEPQAVVADEPARGVDDALEIVAQARAYCRRRGAAMLWTTRDIGAAAKLADRVAILYRGYIVEVGPAASVLRRPAHPYTRALIDSAPSQRTRGERLRPFPAATFRATSSAGCLFRDRCALAMRACLAPPPLQPAGDPREQRGVRCHLPLPIAEAGDA